MVGTPLSSQSNVLLAIIRHSPGPNTPLPEEGGGAREGARGVSGWCADTRWPPLPQLPTDAGLHTADYSHLEPESPLTSMRAQAASRPYSFPRRTEGYRDTTRETQRTERRIRRKKQNLGEMQGSLKRGYNAHVGHSGSILAILLEHFESIAWALNVSNCAASQFARLNYLLKVCGLFVKSRSVLQHTTTS